MKKHTVRVTSIMIFAATSLVFAQASKVYISKDVPDDYIALEMDRYIWGVTSTNPLEYVPIIGMPSEDEVVIGSPHPSGLPTRVLHSLAVGTGAPHTQAPEWARLNVDGTVQFNGDIRLGYTHGSRYIFHNNVNDGMLALAPDGREDPQDYFYWNKSLIFRHDNGDVEIGYNGVDHEEKLWVNGAIGCERIKTREINLTRDAWADHVFAEGYNLKPLSELDAFIKQEERLPGMPSEQEVLKDGVNVGAMQVKLLEKIEELTLHMIDLKKENASLSRRIEAFETVRR